jgi:hypothetical protein
LEGNLPRASSSDSESGSGGDSLDGGGGGVLYISLTAMGGAFVVVVVEVAPYRLLNPFIHAGLGVSKRRDSYLLPEDYYL